MWKKPGAKNVINMQLKMNDEQITCLNESKYLYLDDELTIFFWDSFCWKIELGKQMHSCKRTMNTAVSGDAPSCLKLLAKLMNSSR